MSALTKILQDKLIPWSQSNLQQRMVVARPQMDGKGLPDGVVLESSPIKGKRVIFKAERQYANTRVQIAEWPEAGLLETDNMRLACVVNGRTAYQIHNYLLHAGTGNFIFLPPGTPHPAGHHPHLVDKSGYCELLNFQLYRDAVQCWLCYSENKVHRSFQQENYLIRSEKVVRLFQFATEEATSGESGSQALCENLMSSFFMLLARELESGRYLHTCAKTDLETPIRNQEDFASQVREYIQSHLNETLTLEDAARQMHLSRTQFARQIKRETGQTFLEILTDCRIANAKSLLTDSDWTSAAVAEFVGFKSSNYFISLFQEKTGQTPGQYRKVSRTALNDKTGTNE